MPEYDTVYVKEASDRPDYRQTIRDVHGDIVDLRGAALVQINVWVGDPASLLIDEPATIDAPRLGEVTYDFTREALADSGTAAVEFRVEWDDGDHQWFPIEQQGYPLEIVPPPGPRGTNPSTGLPILTVNDGETYDVDGTETYSRVENGGTIRAAPGDVIRTG